MSVVIYSFSKEAVHEGTLILVNRDYPLKLRRQYLSGELTMVDARVSEILLRNVAALNLKNIFQRIESGDQIVPVSGFRSLREQSELFNTSWLENGEEYTKKFVARPNQSEHQTGLAIDVAEYSEQIDFICPEFSYEGIAMKFREIAAEYGFIERYPKGKEELTGIAHEPWHFRYVGYPHSRIMTLLSMTLEEYVDYLKRFPYEQSFDGSIHLNEGLVYQYGYSEYHIYYVKAEENRTMISLPSDCEFELSGNNVDGFILTVKKECDTGWNQERYLLNGERRITEKTMRTGERKMTQELMPVENTMIDEGEALTSQLILMESTMISEGEALAGRLMPAENTMISEGELLTSQLIPTGGKQV